MNYFGFTIIFVCCLLQMNVYSDDNDPFYNEMSQTPFKNLFESLDESNNSISKETSNDEKKPTPPDCFDFDTNCFNEADPWDN